MGMFDSFFDVVKCPHCEETIQMEFQTKLLGNNLQQFQPDEEVKCFGLVLIEAYVKDGFAMCPACGHHIKGTIWIADGKFVGIKDVIIWEMRS